MGSIFFIGRESSIITIHRFKLGESMSNNDSSLTIKFTIY